MKSRSDEIREYLPNICPSEQDILNPKIFAHLKRISRYDYLFCDLDNIYGYVLVVLKDNLFDTNKKNEYGEVPIDLLVEDEVIIIKKSKYTGKRLNKVNKMIQKGV